MPDPIVWEIALPYLFAAFIFGYAFGSVPFGLIFTKLFSSTDLRSIGSGNIGATNVLRTGSKPLAAATLVADMAKGGLPVWLAGMYGPDQAVMAGLGAFLGHCYPVWLKFRGGKGMATFIGVAIAAYVPVVIVIAVVWLTLAFITRYSSLAALIASVAATIAFFVFGHIQWGEVFIVLTLILWWKHSDNIKRLLQGNENKIGG